MIEVEATWSDPGLLDFIVRALPPTAWEDIELTGAVSLSTGTVVSRELATDGAWLSIAVEFEGAPPTSLTLELDALCSGDASLRIELSELDSGVPLARAVAGVVPDLPLELCASEDCSGPN